MSNLVPASARRHALTAAIVAIAIAATPALAHADGSECKRPGLAVVVSLAPLGVGLAAFMVAERSRTDAVVWLAVATGSASMILGPSAGHIYAGAPRRALAGSLVRLTAAGATVAGFVLSPPCLYYCPPKEPSDDGETRDQVGHGLLVAGVVSFMLATAYDVIGAGIAAHEHNERLALTPTVVGGGASQGYGLALSGRF